MVRLSKREWRIKNREEGDPENPRITKKERSSRGLYNAISEEYAIPEGEEQQESRKKVEKWVEELSDDAAYNFTSYAECFTSENLVRKSIQEKKIPLSDEAKTEIAEYQQKEKTTKGVGHVSIDIRRSPNQLCYLSMDSLANLVDKPAEREKKACLANDAKEYKPIRDAVMHTALLTDEAKGKLTSVFDNIKARVKALLSN